MSDFEQQKQEIKHLLHSLAVAQEVDRKRLQLPFSAKFKILIGRVFKGLIPPVPQEEQERFTAQARQRVKEKLAHYKLQELGVNRNFVLLIWGNLSLFLG